MEAAFEAAGGRMIVKVEAALGAIERGLGQVVFSDARAEHPIRRALAGEGTVVRSPGLALAEIADAEAAR
jgi:acetylglutamate/LysW-gamma-L-alpha-aminoadipate kinase